MPHTIKHRSQSEPVAWRPPLIQPKDIQFQDPLWPVPTPPHTHTHPQGLSNLTCYGSLSLSHSTPSCLLFLYKSDVPRPLHLLSFCLESTSLDPSDLYSKVAFSKILFDHSI